VLGTIPYDLRKIRRKTSGNERQQFRLFERASNMNVSSMRASLEIAANEAKFFEIFFVSLDFFFVTFFCIKTKESKANSTLFDGSDFIKRQKEVPFLQNTFSVMF
jgi:hypothetical protein